MEMQTSKHPTRNIDVALLRAFAATSVTGNMTLAAEMLNRTQGAVSQQIARLEALFGTQLFDRRPGTMRLTADGERLLVGAHRMIADNDALFALMKDETTEPELRLGMPPDIVGAIAPPALRAFRDLRPNVNVILVSQGTRQLRAMIDRGDVDLALTTDAAPRADGGALFEGNLVWVGAQNGTAHMLRPMPVALGEHECAFRAATVNALVTAGTDWRSVFQIGSLEPVLASIAADTAIGVFVEQTVPPSLTRITDAALPKLPVVYVNLHHKRKEMGKAANDLITCLQNSTKFLSA